MQNGTISVSSLTIYNSNILQLHKSSQQVRTEEPFCGLLVINENSSKFNWSLSKMIENNIRNPFQSVWSFNENKRINKHNSSFKKHKHTQTQARAVCWGVAPIEETNNAVNYNLKQHLYRHTYNWLTLINSKQTCNLPFIILYSILHRSKYLFYLSSTK